jgi:hypothetical protein
MRPPPQRRPKSSTSMSCKLVPMRTLCFIRLAASCFRLVYSSSKPRITLQINSNNTSLSFCGGQGRGRRNARARVRARGEGGSADGEHPEYPAAAHENHEKHEGAMHKVIKLNLIMSF